MVARARGGARRLPAPRGDGDPRRARAAGRRCSRTRSGCRAPRRVLAELLPSVGGLHDLADDGPRALARPAARPDRAAARRAPLVLVQAPLGVVGVRGGRVVAVGRAGARDGRRAAGRQRGRALDAARASASARRSSAAACRRADRARRARRRTSARSLDRVVDTRPPQTKGTMLVLDGAPLDAHRHRRAVGRVRRRRPPPRGGRAARARCRRSPSRCSRRSWRGARRLRPGDPRQPDTEIGPLRVAARRASASRSSSPRPSRRAPSCCAAARSTSPGVAGAFYAPAVLRGVPTGRAAAARAGARAGAGGGRGRDRTDEAIALAKRRPAVSVWAGDRARGERVARELEAEVAWVNEHGHSIPDAAVRLAAPRRRAPPRLPADAPALGALAPLRPAARARLRPPPPASCTAARRAPRVLRRRRALARTAAAGARGAAARSRPCGPRSPRAPEPPRQQRHITRRRTRPRRAARRSGPDPTRSRSRGGSPAAAARP